MVRRPDVVISSTRGIRTLTRRAPAVAVEGLLHAGVPQTTTARLAAADGTRRCAPPDTQALDAELLAPVRRHDRRG